MCVSAHVNRHNKTYILKESSNAYSEQFAMKA